jgi:16S rRNA (cytidine1402-2'-O)-methyltransferase
VWTAQSIWVIIAKPEETRAMPTLYVVATPIGNLEDITLRALRVLREVKLIAAEDTRRTKRLAVTYDIKTPMTSYHQHNKREKLGYILRRLEDEDVALVADAGMPGVSDPGYELVVAASERAIPVVPIPGPSAITTALAVSGLAGRRFIYIGFLPGRVGERRRVLESVADESGAVIVLEPPHRLAAALRDILLVLGDRRVAVCRELTKVHEEIFWGTVRPVLTQAVETGLQGMRQSGVTAKEAITQVAGQTGLSKRELYRAWLK